MALGLFRYLQRWGATKLGRDNPDDAGWMEQRDKQLEDYLSSVGIDLDALRALSGYIKSDGSGTFSAQALQTVSETAPASPAVGDMWFNSTTGVHYVYYDGYWIEGGGLGQPAIIDTNGNLVLPVTSGVGIQLGTVGASGFGWKDLIGAIQPKTAGAGTPTLAAFRAGQVRSFWFAANDKIDLVFHMPHDWVPGTDLFIHVHWGHNGTNISGSFVFDFHTTFARGFNQSSNGTFPAEVNTTLTVGSLSIANTPQYRHRTDEVQLSAASPTANQIDTDTLEVDGLLLITGVMTTIPTITGGSPNDPYIFTIDLHYQSHGGGTTIAKAPNFYTP